MHFPLLFAMPIRIVISYRRTSKFENRIGKEKNMFAFIKGELVYASPLNVIVETNGIGYKIFVPASVFSKLPQLGNAVFLHVSYVVRELSHTLYGFLSVQERDLFEMLMGVTGIGPKLALSLIGHMILHDLKKAITNGEIVVICKVPGIGKKNCRTFNHRIARQAASTVSP